MCDRSVASVYSVLVGPGQHFEFASCFRDDVRFGESTIIPEALAALSGTHSLVEPVLENLDLRLIA